MLDRCCVICYNNHSLKMKGVLEMKVVDLIKRLQRYPMGASVSIEGDMLRVAGYTSCICSPAYIPLKDIVSKKFPLSKEKRDAVLEALNVLHNTCKGTDCSNCVLASDSGDCILLLNSPDRWGLETVGQNCKEE
jgi:hypothetical protein